MTPNSRHNGETESIMKKIIKVYEAARDLNPSRFNRGIRDWTPPDKVALNPTEEIRNKLNIV